MLRSARGFSLIELAVVVLVMGLLLGFSIPAYQSFSSSHQVGGAAENIAGQLRLARQKAIATGVPQPMHFYYNTYNADYHIHIGSFVASKWKLPRGVTYLWSTGTLTNMRVTLTPDGRASQSGLVILQNRRGLRDTVSVQLSGLVLVH